MVEHIFPDPAALHFVWGLSRASLRRMSPYDDGYMLDPWDHLHYIKPLTKVREAGWRLEGAEADDELKHLAAYLATLKDEPNVRTIEKRRWRDRLSSR